MKKSTKLFLAVAVLWFLSSRKSSAPRPVGPVTSTVNTSAQDAADAAARGAARIPVKSDAQRAAEAAGRAASETLP